MTILQHRAPQHTWDSINTVLQTNSTFVILTHVNPDGDGLGAELGLYSFLAGQGKTARIINHDAVPERYAFLNHLDCFEQYVPEKHDEFIQKADAALILDTGRWDRLGRVGQAVKNSSAQVVCLDHHPQDEEQGFDYYGLDISAAATGLVVYELLLSNGVALTREMALGLYTSILTDTGSFRFSNTDSRVHRAVADMLDTGLQPAEIYNQVYGEWSLAKVRLLTDVLEQVTLSTGRGAAVAAVTFDLLRESGATQEDAEGLIDFVRNIEGVEVVGFLRQEDNRVFKVSFRSKGRVNVREIAAKFGGGGHVYAAGGRVRGDEEESRQAVMTALEKAVAEHA